MAMPYAILYASPSTTQPLFTVGWARPSCSPPGEAEHLRRSSAFGSRAQLKPHRDLSYMWSVHKDPNCGGHESFPCSLDRGQYLGAAQHPSCSASPHHTDQSQQPGCHLHQQPKMGNTTQLCLPKMVTLAATNPVYMCSQLQSPMIGAEKAASSIHNILAGC